MSLYYYFIILRRNTFFVTSKQICISTKLKWLGHINLTVVLLINDIHKSYVYDSNVHFDLVLPFVLKIKEVS